MQNGEGGAEVALVAGCDYDVLALTVATGLGVFKPGRRLRRKSASTSGMTPDPPSA
jgi:hypothetical protein